MTPIDQAARTAQAGQELLQASGDVIARRLRIVADAWRDPGTADLVELSLMGSEKVAALAASAGVGLTGASALAATGAAAASRETAAAHRAFKAVIGAPDPASGLSAHNRWAVAATARAFDYSWAFGAAMLKLQADALAPVHAAAIANARRLKS